jgi:hypothetical protein
MSDHDSCCDDRAPEAGRQGTDGDVYYHYNREERLALRPDRRDPSGGILKGNRSLTIILLDVLIVAIIFLIFRFVVFTGDSPPSIKGYTVTADLLETSGGVLGLVTLEAGREPEASSGIFTVRMTEVDADEGAVVEVKDLLPEPENRRRVSELFPEGTRAVNVVVEIDDETLELRTGLDTEGTNGP